MARPFLLLFRFFFFCLFFFGGGGGGGCITILRNRIVVDVCLISFESSGTEIMLRRPIVGQL